MPEVGKGKPMRPIEQASAFAAATPTSREPISPGLWPTANASISSSVTPAERSALSTIGSMFSQ